MWLVTVVLAFLINVECFQLISSGSRFGIGYIPANCGFEQRTQVSTHHAAARGDGVADDSDPSQISPIPLGANLTFDRIGDRHTNDEKNNGKISYESVSNSDTAMISTVGKPLSLSTGIPTDILAIDPSTIEITQTLEPTASSSIASHSSVKMFRGAATYIASHRNAVFVFHLPGELLEWEGISGLMDDIALSWLLWAKIIIVAGSRLQIDNRLNQEASARGEFDAGIRRHRSIRVTDAETARVVKEESGYVRFEVERWLAKSLKARLGNPRDMEGMQSDGMVVSGNFYSAQPYGVIDGVDYMYTGFPRRVEVDKIRGVLNNNDLVLLAPLGSSPSGEMFNVNSEYLAAYVAGSMNACKVIYLAVQCTEFRTKGSKKLVQNLRVSDAKNLLSYHKVKIHSKGFASIEDGVQHSPGVTESLLKIGWSTYALERGVKRAHVITPVNGALLLELYTRDGSGTLISRDVYEGIRPADVNDVAAIYDLIKPLINAGTLVNRPKTILEKDINSYYVYTRDDLIVACGQIKQFEGGMAEIGCLVTNVEYRSQGRGDAMLGYLERLSIACECSTVFVLSTQTMQWFVERGFREEDLDKLPPSRRAVYNHKRKSKIYVKKFNSVRDLDLEELLWNM